MLDIVREGKTRRLGSLSLHKILELVLKVRYHFQNFRNICFGQWSLMLLFEIFAQAYFIVWESLLNYNRKTKYSLATFFTVSIINQELFMFT